MTTLPDDILDLLIAYALGAIEPAELPRVSALLAEQPELRAVLAELRATADQLPYALPEAAPASELRQRTLDYATGRATRQPKAASSFSQRARAWITGLATIAAVALVAAAVGWAQFFSATDGFQQQAGQRATAQAELAQLQAQISTAQKVLASMHGAAGQAALVQTSAGQAVFVAQLPPLAPNRVYQLWRIQGNNPPANAGLLTVDAQGFGQAALISGQPLAGEVIAITDEPAGGSPGPTTQPLMSSTINA